MRLIDELYHRMLNAVGEYDDFVELTVDETKQILELLKEQEAKVMTFDEVKNHYSLPPVFPDDLGMQEDYLNDIEPLYFDFPDDSVPWTVHWRCHNQVAKYLNDWKADYGKKWRCWTAKPTDEQRKAVKWDAAD